MQNAKLASVPNDKSSEFNVFVQKESDEQIFFNCVFWKVNRCNIHLRPNVQISKIINHMDEQNDTAVVDCKDEQNEFFIRKML